MKQGRVAIIHDWLTGISGTEQVLKEVCAIYPEAPVFVLYYDPRFSNNFLPGKKIIASISSKGAFTTSLVRIFGFVLFPFMIEYIDLRDYDLIISTGTIFSKGVITRSQSLHINYCHSPTRQIWDWSHEYVSEGGKKPMIVKRIYQHLFRIWDFEAAQRPDIMIANSRTTQQRIKKYYARDADIIYPPVSIHSVRNTNQGIDIETNNLIRILKKSDGYFLIIGRMYPHKNIEIAIHAFEKLGWNLVVIGEGPLLRSLAKKRNKNIHILGYKNNTICAQFLENCLGFIMPQEEDFGISSVEAIMSGKPVLALRRGGALEYIDEKINGMFFDDPTEEVLAWGIKRFRDAIRNKKFDQEKIRQTAEKFKRSFFHESIEKVSKM